MYYKRYDSVIYSQKLCVDKMTLQIFSIKRMEGHNASRQWIMTMMASWLCTYASFVRVEKGAEEIITRGVEEKDASFRKVHLPGPILKVDGIQWGGRVRNTRSCVGGDCLETVKAMFEIGENQAVEFRWKDQSRVAVPVGLQDSGNRSRERSLGHYTEIPFISSCRASINL